LILHSGELQSKKKLNDLLFWILVLELMLFFCEAALKVNIKSTNGGWYD